MSDPLPCPKSPSCLASCRKCVRLMRVMLALAVAAALVAACLLGVLIRDSRTAADPKPTPSPTAPEDPAPSPHPTKDPTSDPKATAPMPPDPTGTACNIFDPECPNGTGGTGGLET